MDAKQAGKNALEISQLVSGQLKPYDLLPIVVNLREAAKNYNSNGLAIDIPPQNPRNFTTEQHERLHHSMTELNKALLKMALVGEKLQPHPGEKAALAAFNEAIMPMNPPKGDKTPLKKYKELRDSFQRWTGINPDTTVGEIFSFL